MGKIEEIKKGLSGGIVTATQQFGVPAIDVLVSQHPEWMPIWLFAKGMFGSAMQLKQDKLNWFIEDAIARNAELFTEEVLNSEDFQIVLVTTLENYLKQRHKEKVDLIVETFIAFTKDKDKKQFEIERLQNTVDLISLESIEFLKLYISVIDPGFLKDKITEQRGKMSTRIEDYVRSVGGHDYLLRFRQGIVAELVSLGLVQIIGVKDITYEGESKLEYDFSGYGVQFLYHLKNLAEKIKNDQEFKTA